jgi:hypothetical protein
MLVSELLRRLGSQKLAKEVGNNRNAYDANNRRITRAMGSEGMLEDLPAPAPKLFASSWWARLATIAVERERRSQKKRRRWTQVLRKLIRTRSN